MYISTPNGVHYEWTVKALKAGKHVLCEKPFMANAKEAREVTGLAKERGLVLEEAVCYLSPWLMLRKGFSDRISSTGNSILPRMHGANCLIRRTTARFFVRMPL